MAHPSELIERLLSQLAEANAKIEARDAEIKRLEDCLNDMEFKDCNECNRRFDVSDLTEINGDSYCPDCTPEAMAKDAYEARADKSIDSEYARSRR